MAPAAFAGTIRYTIPEAPQYTVADNGNGIVKVTYNGCVTAGERQQFDFGLAVNVTNADGNATFNILREEGLAPTAVFTPPSIFLRKGAEQTFNVSLAFTLDEANNGLTTFRIKLDPESGEGLGQGAGIMVSLPCVLAAPAPAAAAGQTGGPAPAGSPTEPARAPDGTPMPTAGFLPAVGGVLAARASSCVSTPNTSRLRANETSTVLVRVAKGAQTLRGALVRVTYPGGTRTARTGSSGTVTFRIRPSRAGRLVIQSEVCFGADRIRVLGARVTKQGARPARFTG